MFQVALKRQQAAEDSIALGLTAVMTGKKFGFLPPGPIFGMAVPDPIGTYLTCECILGFPNLFFTIRNSEL